MLFRSYQLLSTNPVPVPTSGAFAGGGSAPTALLRYRRIGTAVTAIGSVTIPTGGSGTAGGGIKVPIPFVPTASGFIGAEDASAGVLLLAYVNVSDANIYLWLPGFVNAVADNKTYYFSGQYAG